MSVPLACGILEILAGRVPPDRHPESVERWLAYLAEQGITANYHRD